MDEYADSVCKDSMNTAPGRDEEDACSSVSARGSTDDNRSADGCAKDGSKNTYRD